MTANSFKLRSWGPLALSAALHAGLALAGAAVLTVLPPPHVHAQHRDAWAGDTFQIDGLVSEPGAGQHAQRAPAGSKPAPAAAKVVPPPAPAVQATPRSAEPATLLTARAARAAAPGHAPARPHVPAAHAKTLPPARAHVATPAAGASAHASGAGAPDLSSAMAAAAKGNDGPHGGRFGAAGVLPGVRDLAKAFTRALPRAASGDPLWTTLPLGPAGGFHVVIRIDHDRRIESAKPDEEQLPPILQHMLDRTVLMLKAGQFALDRSDLTSGDEKLHVEVTLSMRAPSDQINVRPGDTIELGFKPPTRDRPGRGYFTLASGRHVEAKVTIEPSP